MSRVDSVSEQWHNTIYLLDLTPQQQPCAHYVYQQLCLGKSICPAAVIAVFSAIRFLLACCAAHVCACGVLTYLGYCNKVHTVWWPCTV
jgi:hypothetical protein